MATRELTKQEKIAEFVKCANDYEYFLRNYIKVPVPGMADDMNFDPYPCQKRFIDSVEEVCTKDSDKTGVIFLASRQCGKTVLAESRVVWLVTFHSSYQVLFMSRDEKFGILTMHEMRDMLSKLPVWMRPRFKKKLDTVLMFKNNSSIVLQASNKTNQGSSTKGRGLRPTFIWIDEAAFMPLLDHLASIMPAVSKSFLVAKENGVPHGILLTSTPNGRSGMGEGFYKYWSVAESTPDMSAFRSVKIHWKEVPGYDEEWFKARCKELSWDMKKIKQEYDLVFTGTLDAIFDDTVLELLQDEQYAGTPISKNEMGECYIHWFEMPSPKERYLIGIDSAGEGSDYFAVSVTKYSNLEQICEGKYKGRTPEFIDTFLPYILQLLKKKVFMVEKNGVGLEVVNRLIEKGYERYIVKDTLTQKDKEKAKIGFAQTSVSRPLLLEQLVHTISQEHTLLKSKGARLEAASLEKKRGGRIEGFPHDDLIFAYGFTALARTYYDAASYFDDYDFEDGEGSEIDISLFAIAGNDDGSSAMLPNVSDSFRGMFGQQTLQDMAEYKNLKKSTERSLQTSLGRLQELWIQSDKD